MAAMSLAVPVKSATPLASIATPVFASSATRSAAATDAPATGTITIVIRSVPRVVSVAFVPL